MPSLMEFNEEVTCKYGINSRPGTRAIINLVKKADAKDVNIFALYEYAEMLFYGIQNGPEPDINAAFEAFKSISNMNDGSPCHPLAHWSLSFIYFNYRQRGSELEDCDIIPELDDMELIDRVTKSLIHAKYAFILTKNPAAANILGKICMLTDDDVPGIEEIIKKHRLKTAVDYFEEATKQNYIYAFGSLSNVYLEKMFEDPTNQEDHLNKYLEALKGQADQFEPWAANKLGLFYLTGTVKSRKTQETLTFDRIDRNLSYEYFEKAVQYYFDSNSGWAYANMIVNFPKKYIADEDYSKLKSHLEKLVKIHNEEAINYVRDNFKGVYGVFEDNKTCDELLRIINK